MKKIMVSGIKPTGDLTIGNYIGAIKNFVKLQEENKMFIFIADLHALTIEINREELRENKRNIAALYLAAGLDPEKVILFNQSDVLEHAQLSWILENRTTVGELSRMTQFKDKSQGAKVKNGTAMIKTGLLTYPALMAADILLYNPDAVPVGDDQKQHLELTRNIAARFNNRFGETFKIPEPIISQIGARIMSLTNPEKKMSKTDKSEKSYITLLEDPKIARKKIMKAVTDSEGKVYLSDNKPGVKNLLTIYSSLKNIDIADAVEEFKNKNYGEFKLAIADEVEKFLTNIQKKYKIALQKVDQVLEQGKTEARKVAKKMMEITSKKIGIK